MTGLIALAACGTASEEQPVESDPLIEAEVEARSELAESGVVYCALNGAVEMRSDCQIERSQSDDGLVLTVRHPDGGFRRLLVTNDGSGLVAADGAEAVTVTPTSEREIEVAIGGDTYRLPATVR
ncbi:hypothetical protein [Parasphingopyxis sp.]|uniref:hypothetical protein n=1 Tax=Parasphingopyxis sp. TaxID=1920299 RepID=UPI00261E53A3|nr:hypothetical protein [Parasphingopyxis sp.]